MELKYNDSVVEKNCRREMRDKYNNSEKWKNYASRAIKNPFIRNYLMTKYNGICQYCGMPIRKNLTIQHMDYDYECITDKTFKIDTTTENGKHRFRKVPPCENCINFKNCVSKWVPVHSKCNMLMALKKFKMDRYTK